MKFPIYQVDAFTSRLYGGNPAAVVLLPEWLDDATLQSIASENNLSETSFLVHETDGYRIRWFTPTVEVELCGHATLASAHVLFQRELVPIGPLRLASKSGELVVERDGDLLVLDFPSDPPSPVEKAAPISAALCAAIGAEPTELLEGRYHLAVFETEREVAALSPDFAKLAATDHYAVVCTAPGDSCDFVSRFFGPNVGVPEDPVTGSAHCMLVPFWANRLDRPALHARQISARGGELFCEDRGDRVRIAGHAVEYLAGEIRARL